MTKTGGKLREQPRLLKLALEHTQDVNEAHLFVHRVMARALGGAAGAAMIVDPLLVRALGIRPAALSCAMAPE